MNIELLSGAGLDPAVRDAWYKLQAQSPHLASPFFSPAWVECVAAARDDVQVAVIEQGGEVHGILPFQKRGLEARPAGGPLCDFQGLIGRVPAGYDLADVLARAGIGVWSYDHLLLAKDAAEEGLMLDSPYMDLSDGLNAYAEERRAAGSKQIRQIQRKLRKLEREVGELRFEWEISDGSALASLFEWKASYYARMGTTDRFAHDWIREVISNVLSSRESGCYGLLSGLWAGDRLLAVHMGMRSESVFHYWFPTYDPEYGRYSPGLGLLLEMAGRCCEEGIVRLDLGRGDERYKSSMASDSLPIAEGALTARSIAGRCYAGYAAAREHARHWPILEPIKRLTRGHREEARFK